MRNKLLAPAVLLAAFVLVTGIFWWSHHPSVADSSPPPQSAPVTPDGRGMAQPAFPGVSTRAATAAAAASPTLPGDGTTAVAPVPGGNSLPPSGKASAPMLAAVPPEKAQAMAGLEKTRRMIHDYHTLMGENPVGTNAEIMKALMGGNSHQATLGPLEGQQLNDKGELVDQWGTPYFLHQLSGSVMEIHSAGPDKIMGTPDDLVLR